jgi:enoyl-CoA hydratase/carnithine racemase
MSEDKIIARREGAIGWLIYNNPERRNAFSRDMAIRAAAVIDEFATDDGVVVIALTGTGGKSFVSGADISEFEKLRASQEQAAKYEAQTRAMFTKLRGVQKPTVAVIQGYCMGGGMGVACACDLRICTEDSIFGIPAARLGIGYRANATRWVVDAVGPANAKEILLTARRYDAAEALRIGLVHRVVPVAEFETFTAEYLAAIADNAPLSMRTAKVTVNEVSKGVGECDEALCNSLADACADSEDYREGRTAFMEKRRPVFAGR